MAAVMMAAILMTCAPPGIPSRPSPSPTLPPPTLPTLLILPPLPPVPIDVPPIRVDAVPPIPVTAGVVGVVGAVRVAGRVVVEQILSWEAELEILEGNGVTEQIFSGVNYWKVAPCVDGTRDVCAVRL